MDELKAKIKTQHSVIKKIWKLDKSVEWTIRQDCREDMSESRSSQDLKLEAVAESPDEECEICWESM